MKRSELTDALSLRRTGLGRRVFWLAILAVLLVVAWNVVPGYGQSRRDRHGRWGHDRGTAGTDDLQFLARRLHPEDAAARDRFVAIVARALDEAEIVRADADRLSASIADQLRADHVDPAALAHLRQEADDVARRAVGAGFEALQRVVVDLTPEQRRVLAGYFEERHR